MFGNIFVKRVLCWRQTGWNQDQVPHNVGPDLGSSLFAILQVSTATPVSWINWFDCCCPFTPHSYIHTYISSSGKRLTPVTPAQVFLVVNCLSHAWCVWHTGARSNNDPICSWTRLCLSHTPPSLVMNSSCSPLLVRTNACEHSVVPVVFPASIRGPWF